MPRAKLPAAPRQRAPDADREEALRDDALREVRGRGAAKGIDAIVATLQERLEGRGGQVHIERMEATDAVFGAWPRTLPAALRAALEQLGMTRPWLHQSDAWARIRAGEDVVMVTPTASGKSLGYTVPIVERLLQDPQASVLLLFPTKALTQDQAASLNRLLEAAGLPDRAQIYDGDTPADLRRAIREQSRVVLTNPDMLHASILPNHERWRRLFATLAFVVVDEMHVYRGVFGSHVANVLWRLHRIARHVGSTPQRVLASATIANPVELGEALTGTRLSLVAESGAPRGARWFVVYNPPIVDAELGRRQSPGAAAQQLATELLLHGHSCIVFARSRQGVEIVTRRLRETLERRKRPELAHAVSGYRGGYLPEERRRIERGLRDGAIRAVVSTNALELGIDIGSLDACLIASFPGTIASTWQQAGRAGRRNRSALVVLIAGEESVDQYLAQHPEFFFGASPEHGRINPSNLRVLAEHLKCAIHELAMHPGEAWRGFSVEETQEVVEWLAEQTGHYHFVDGAWRWAAEAYPAADVSLRALVSENFVIIDVGRETNEILGEIDFESAHVTVYENAIYQHATRLYHVERLDYDERKAWVREVESEYYTQAIDQTRAFVLDIDDEGVVGPGLVAGHGEIRVAQRFVGFKKIRFRTFENIGYGEIRLPDLELHTSAFWLACDAAALRDRIPTAQLGTAMSGASRALHTVAMVHVMCTGDDLRVLVQGREGEAWTPVDLSAPTTFPTPLETAGLTERPAIFLYDRTPGGTGLSDRLHEHRNALVRDALALVARCPCERGCPACVGADAPEGQNARQLAHELLGWMAERMSAAST